jgi:hypothetical protein
MARLTNRDKQLLLYPPTQETWKCGRVTKDEAGNRAVCGVAQSGERTFCWVCGTSKPPKAKLIWPEYIAACVKARIQPGSHWPPRQEDS